MASEGAARNGLGRVRSVSPRLPPNVRLKLHAFVEYQLEANEDDHTALAGALRKLNADWKDDPYSLKLRSVCVLIADLVEQGWEVDTEHDRVVLMPPGLFRHDAETIDEAKERLRRSLCVGRNRQLQEPAVRQFIQRMERPFRRPVGKFSVLDLVDDGRDLAARLRQLNSSDVTAQEGGLDGVIHPLIQPCDNDERCSITGLKLIDVWRYFRHTWSLEYRSIPGRQMPLLIRNARRPNMPVIGIALLASPVLRSVVRDDWIGWTRGSFEANLRSGLWDWKTAAEALCMRVDAATASIRWDDFATAEEIANPSERLVFRLEQRGMGAAEARVQALREQYGRMLETGIRSQRDPFKRKQHAENADWRSASEDFLFVRKRAQTLAGLVRAKLVFQEASLLQDPEVGFERLFTTRQGQGALDVALKETRKAGLSTQVADVSVCGAIAPYNELLGGKLVALLLTSREVRELYRKRYGNQISLIASQLAGRPIRKPADLRMLTTTSLYGVGSSQYNRLKLLAADFPELQEDIEWRYLKKTAGYGSVHLGNETVRALRTLSEEEYGARRVNNRFGEGSSPRLRQIREGLDALGINSDQILNHATPRIFYACALGENAREQLIGLSNSGPSAGSSVEAIAAAWRRRWLMKRIQRNDVVERVQRLGPVSVKAQLNADQDGQFLLPFDS